MKYRHTFVPIDDRATWVVSEVSARQRRHLLWGLVGLIMWLSLPLLLATRSRNTRQLLEGGAA
ncbi:MAG: hypothetical protein PVH11_05445 [Anaerolineae bacterium]|jgi:hypothetical protein